MLTREQRVAESEQRLQRLRLLGSAVAARPIEVAAAEPGALPWTDGSTVYLDPAASRSDQLLALAVQASMLAAGSLDAAVLEALGGRRRSARRYLAVEGHRALLANERFLPDPVSAMIDRTTAMRSRSPMESVELAAAGEPVPEPPAAFGVLRPRVVLEAQSHSGLDQHADGSARDSSRHTQADPLPDIDSDDDEHDEAEDLGQLLASPVGGGGPIGRLLKRLLSSTRQRSRGGGPPGGDVATHSGRNWHGGSSGVVSNRATVPMAEEPGSSGAPFCYPEWDVNRHRYRADWCTVVESYPGPDALAWMQPPDGAVLRRRLARLGTGLAPCRRRPDGDDIDIDAVVEAQVDNHAGVAATNRIYVESLRTRRDLSVQILLDISGSANEPGPAGRPVHEHQRAFAGDLTAALAELGDHVALHAFNSQGRSSVRLTVVKGFGDRFDGQVLRRLGGLVPSGYTRMGAAIRHGTAMLEARGGSPRRLLVVISDGFAYDHGYEGRYGESDASRALAEARRKGMGCLCLSIGAGRDARALSRVFGTAAHASVPSQEHLVGQIGPLFRASMLSAESRRRRFQRRERTRELLGIEQRARAGSET